MGARRTISHRGIRVTAVDGQSKRRKRTYKTNMYWISFHGRVSLIDGALIATVRKSIAQRTKRISGFIWTTQHIGRRASRALRRPHSTSCGEGLRRIGCVVSAGCLAGGPISWRHPSAALVSRHAIMTSPANRVNHSQLPRFGHLLRSINWNLPCLGNPPGCRGSQDCSFYRIAEFQLTVVYPLLLCVHRMKRSHQKPHNSPNFSPAETAGYIHKLDRPGFRRRLYPSHMNENLGPHHCPECTPPIHSISHTKYSPRDIQRGGLEPRERACEGPAAIQDIASKSRKPMTTFEGLVRQIVNDLVGVRILRISGC